MQRAQAYLPFVLHSLRRDLRPSTFPILPSPSPGPRFRWNIDVHIVFWIRELAHIFKFKCCTEQRRLELYYGPRYSTQWFCCHNRWGMSHFCQVLLQTLREVSMQIFSNQLVEWNNGGFRSPFVASGCLLLLAWVVISGSWSENYGGGAGAGTAQASADVFQIRRLGAAWRIVAAGAYKRFIHLCICA
jgi:hypothetical protein